ncbi:YhgE/Pip domain-containing protein [Nesterenkonia muleiensis]|uniref:YhgE/Pip domain-containing protein n=1 Tax=Nesterenkonia muleiensis TaxID=2282648 RepID=UPI000E719BB1|nr:YhgE/Pip domain-containing protein [Nesterenkonia muleiensis]
MTFLRLVRSEFERMTSSFTPLITVLGLAMVPVLYSGIYLYANWDPYENLDNVGAALVNLDQGEDFDGEFRTIGDDVTEELIDEASFGWEEVDSRQKAEAGVASGDYQFALIVPEEFSEALASPSSFERADRAMIDIITNEANNYLLSNIVTILAYEIHGSVAEEVGRETADQMLTGFGRIHQEILDAADGAGELEGGIGDLHHGLETLSAGAQELTRGARSLDEGAGEISVNMSELANGLEDLSNGAGQFSTGTGELSSGLADLQNGAGSLVTAAESLSEGASTLNSGLLGLRDGAEQVAQGNEQLAVSGQEAAAILQEFEDAAAGRADQAVTDLIAAGLITEEQSEEAHAALADASEDSQLIERAQSARTQLQEAQSDVDQLAAGARSVADGAQELHSGSSELSTGASQLASQAPDLAEGVTNAKQGADSLDSAADELSTGADTAYSGARQLSAGAAELAEGTSELSDGAAGLRHGLGDAQDGAGELLDGSGELVDGLSSGAGDVPNPDEGERAELSDVIGNPLEVNKTSQAEAGNYGAGMAPFFLALSLWIGALVMLQVLRPTSPRALASNANPFSIALGSWIPFLLLSLAQSGLLYAAVVLGLGLTPAHPLFALAILLAASMAFSALVQGVVTLLGNPGKMLIIFLLVLQLVASGGTFPPQTLPAPLQALHHVLPMSYAVDGLRHVIYGADLGAFSTTIGALLVTALIGFGLLVLAVYKKKMWDLERLHPAIEEAQ